LAVKRILWASWSEAEAQQEVQKLRASSVQLDLEWAPLWEVPETQWKDTDIFLLSNFMDPTPYPKGRIARYIYEPITSNPSRWREVLTAQDELTFTWHPAFHGKSTAIAPCFGFWLADLEAWAPFWRQERLKDYLVVMYLSRSPGSGAFYDIRGEREKLVRSFCQVLSPEEFHYGGRGWEPVASETQEYFLGSLPGHWSASRDPLSLGRYVIVLENTYDAFYSLGYLSEKVWNVWLAGGVPVYLGCSNVKQMIPEDTFLDLDSFWGLIPEEHWWSCVASLLKSAPLEVHTKKRRQIVRWLASEEAKTFSADRVFQHIERNCVLFFS